MRANEVELALAEWIGICDHLMIPNLSWGFNGQAHECDLAVITPSGYFWEFEIKVSKADVLRDQRKRKWRRGLPTHVREFWFAIPEDMAVEEILEMVPEGAGVVSVKRKDRWLINGKTEPAYHVRVMRRPMIRSKARKITDKEQVKLAQLAAMRIWGLKKKLVKLQRKDGEQ